MSGSTNNDQPDTRTNDRLSLGHAWMMCSDCGAKLYDFDGHRDKDIRCP